MVLLYIKSNLIWYILLLILEEKNKKYYSLFIKLHKNMFINVLCIQVLNTPMMQMSSKTNNSYQNISSYKQE